MTKFKVGDKVEYRDPIRGMVKGVVKDVDYDGHPGNVYVDFGNGAGSVPESRLRAVNAKFKVGDKVTTTAFPSKPGMKDKVWTITEVIRDGYYRVETKYGNSGTQTAALEEKWLHSANSANPTVANAINACAKNAEKSNDDLNPRFQEIITAWNNLARAFESFEKALGKQPMRKADMDPILHKMHTALSEGQRFLKS